MGKIISYAAVVLLVLFLAFIIWFDWSSYLRTKNRDYIEKETARLVKPHTVVFTSDKAKACRLAIKRGDYAEAQKFADDVFKNSRMLNWRFYPFNVFVADVMVENDPAFIERLNEWVEQDTNSAMAYLMRSEYYYKIAWGKRGGNFISYTPSDSLNLFEKYMEMANADIQKSIEIDDKNPYSYYALLNIAFGHGDSPEMEQYFQEAISKFPNYYSLYAARLRSISPKWGGSVDKMYNFVNKYAGETTSNPFFKLLYVQLYSELLENAGSSCSAVTDMKSICIREIMEKVATSALEDNVRYALGLYNTTDKYQFTWVLGFILKDMVFTGYSYPEAVKEYFGKIYGMAVQVMDGGGQVVNGVKKQTNYMLDELEAFRFYTTRDYVSAEKKYNDALVNIEYMDFPDEEEKYMAIASLYNMLSDTYIGTEQYLEAIIYKKASIAMGANIEHGDRHTICYAYHELGDYAEAIKECTIQVDDYGDFPSRYWRGYTNGDSGRMSEALKDFVIVADSGNFLRADAAVSIARVYGNGGDMQNVINTFDKYSFVFNEHNQSRENMAIIYYNRCYAYMKLGELQKALDDCDASIKYNKFPSAYDIRQEIIKMMSANKNNR